MTRRGMVGILVGGAAMLLSGCGDDRWPDYNYKMTVYVGDKAFSSVRRVEQEEVTSIVDSGGRTVKTRVKGQAVILDLPDGRTVYGLLSRPENSDYGAYIANRALAPLITKPKPESEVDAAIREYRDDKGFGKNYLDKLSEEAQGLVKIAGAHPVPRTLPSPDPVRDPKPAQMWPFFVAFDDAKDPKTVREVSPESVGVSRITIEITDEAVTTGIEGRLGWLTTLRGAIVKPKLGGSMFDIPEYQRITEGAFSTEVGL